MGYFLRRIGFFFLTLWAAVTLNFLIPRLGPGDPAQEMVQRLAGQGQAVDPAQVKAVEAMLGVPNTNIFVQYIDYLKALVHGQFGVSYTYYPYSVSHMILQALPWTIALVGITTIIGFIVGNLLGTWAAWRRGTKVDSVISVGSTFIGAIPFFWIALVLIYVFAIQLQWLPQSGGYSGNVAPGWNWAYISDVAQHAILPAGSMVFTGTMGWILGMRNNMVQSLGDDYARFGRAKGLSERTLALNYGARVAILPNVTGFAMSLGALLGGTVFVESAFGYPGLGRLLYEATSNQDYPLMQALLLLVTVGVLLANLVADMLYGILDPRARRKEAV